ncbi:cysteine--tRNA ligase [Pyrinomonas methylaliphatogenes]|jgi:cysteinyl-tRNA synthetase|uniref:Cysteine--tRNA ligase n=1 Tax=Pyrinomonas methylaliphatogenes TaxID=454194 RepID=A0A0B6X360_9BACT|nr:cysteine--tRNA ligase [Pyrinomonas methylaliphatogenes]MBX5480177.1 cysteine--tRNA ligase [Pyrinomonas methylaliphatogenes]CDM66735.1 cysteinyl-tRNA synthetase [Pyrinomonas methylaliphatogenes]
MLKFHNTLSGRLEEFRPLREGEVGFYFCGPTVYDYAHIGNFRSMIFADVLRRYLKFKGYRVTHVMNITDVEDRIIARSQERGITIDEYTAQYIEALWEDFDALGCERPDVVPRATRHIPEMVALIKRLLERGHAYKSDGSIYYRISSFPEYGKLSKINFAGNIVGGSERVDSDRYDKEDARDFALWKAPKTPDEPAWDTEIGRGRPGWHIECSAMSMKYLGETFDIHAGGIDLVFPHHENEIAQSEGATGKQFVRYWLHAEHLKVEGETMSKSRGNYYTFRDLRAQGYKPEGIRYLLLSVPYRKQLNFTFDALRAAEKTVESLRDFHLRLAEARTEPGSNGEVRAAAARAAEEFEAGMDDDLNTSVALAAIHTLTHEINPVLVCGALREDDKRDLLNLVARFDSVLNIFGKPEREMLDSEIQALIDERQEARRRRDWARADEIRNYLAERGIILEDTREGVRWKRR